MEEELIFSASLKKTSDVRSVLFSCFMMSILIVYVNLKPLFKKEVGEGVIHKMLEGWGRIAFSSLSKTGRMSSMLVVLVKTSSGIPVIDSLSRIPLSTSIGLDRKSAWVCSLPGLCERVMSYSWSLETQLACRLVRFCGLR